MSLGSEHQDDLDRLAHDPAMRMATWNRPGEADLMNNLGLLPRYFFLVAHWPRTLRSGEEILAHYRRRGTFSGVRRLGEFNEVIGPHLSSREFVENEVTMLLALLAFNLTTMLRNEFEAAVGGSWPSQ